VFLNAVHPFHLAFLHSQDFTKNCKRANDFEEWKEYFSANLLYAKTVEAFDNAYQHLLTEGPVVIRDYVAKNLYPTRQHWARPWRCQ
jgi:hypothetical protein